MRPQRIKLTHELVSAYELDDHMLVLVSKSTCHPGIPKNHSQRPRRATPEQMTAFHTDEYIEFLNRVTPETAEELTLNGTRCQLPLFCSISSQTHRAPQF